MTKLQKKIVVLFCLLLYPTLNLCSNPKEPLSVPKKTFSKKEKNCTFKVEYPILKLGKNSPHNEIHIKAIGKIFIDDFTNLDSYKNDYECNLKEKNAPAFSLDAGFDVKLLNDSILSIHSTFSSFTEGNAHPQNIYKSYNFNLKTGERISFESLFKKDSKFLIPLHKLMAEILVKEKVIGDKSEFIAVKKNSYDFYLSPEGIHLINLFDVYAMQSVEVKVSYNSIKKYLDTENTLKFVK